MVQHMYAPTCCCIKCHGHCSKFRQAKRDPRVRRENEYEARLESHESSAKLARYKSCDLESNEEDSGFVEFVVYSPNATTRPNASPSHILIPAILCARHRLRPRSAAHYAIALAKHRSVLSEFACHLVALWLSLVAFSLVIVLWSNTLTPPR